MGTGKEGFYGNQLNNLTPGQTYYYRAKTSLNKNALDLIGNDMTLWLDASDLSSTPSTWADKSGNSRNATKGGTPGVVTNAQNGLSLMRFTGNGQKYEWTELTDIRTVFWVLKENASAQHANGSTQFRYLLNDSVQRQINGSNVNPHFHNHRTNDYFWHTGVTDNKITGGTTRLNGTTVNGAATNIPTSLAVVSLKTTGNVIASSFGYDRGITARQWLGDLAELIICDTALSDSDIQKVEGYLAHKWGLQSSLPSSGHSYKTSPPQSTVWSSIKSFTTPINTSAPTLGTQSTANITATAADLEVVLTDNGNAATTLIFYWGDNDGGQIASNWDYNVTISNAPENQTLRASLTGLSSGTTYYFRTWATNTANKGDDWGNNTTSFSTVTSSVREDTDAIRYSIWKVGGNWMAIWTIRPVIIVMV